MSRILVVDDEPAICWSFREMLGDEGHEVEIAASAEDALRLAGLGRFDAVLLDVRLPGMDGLTALPLLRETLGDVPIVVMTAFGDLETAVKAVEAKAFDYLVKPFDLDHASAVVRRALEASRAPKPIAGSPVATRPADDALIGSSAAMQALFQAIAMVASAEVPVLVTGESGTGKELVARALHRYGTRREGPFVPVSLPSLSPAMVEAELFGHAKGAFPGATSERKGIFELAKGGTVLLDEIGDASPALQVKLLRAIEHREVTPVGEARPRPIDARIVAATHRDLPELVAAGAFREDLYFRLAAFPIRVPALRERLDDVPALANHFLERARGRSERLSAEVLVALRARPWPGNVRELRNAIERAAILSRGGPIRIEHLAEPGVSGAKASADLASAVAAWTAARPFVSGDGDVHSEFLGEVEPPLLRAVLDQCAGNRAAAAQRLGIDRATLRLKLRRYGLE